MNKFLKSFKYAFHGLSAMMNREQNFRIQVLVAIMALVGCYSLKVSGRDTILVMICIAAVLAFEILNSAIEKLCDFISPERNEQIKIIKDMSAAAVLVVSIMAFVVGLIIFLPKLVGLILS